MLARIAESCYWIGRFLERADYTARLLDVHYHNLLQTHYKDSKSMAKHLASTMGISYVENIETIESAVESIAFDAIFPGSIVDSIHNLSENAKGARDTISTELFEAIYATHIELQQRLLIRSEYSRHDLFRWIRSRTMLIHGLIDETMSRDDAYHFLNIGRCIERVDMSARMVAVRCEMDNTSFAWTTMLKSCGAYESYMKKVGDTSDTYSIIEFLLKDAQFPRSVLSTLSSALASVQSLLDTENTFEEDDPRFALGRMCAEIEFISVQEVHDDLMKAVVDLQHSASFINKTMENKFFLQADAIEWRK